MRVLVTGAGGFIGRALVERLAQAGRSMRCCGRHAPPAKGWTTIDLADPDADLDPACRGVDCIVHLAAHVHVGPLQRLFDARRFHEINAVGTERLARAALRQGVRRFVYLSSIGVQGPAGDGGDGAPRPFTEADAPRPMTTYARSKYDGECRLRELCARSGLEYTILRAPLVFGPGVGGNFRRLLDAVRHEWPVPVGTPAPRTLVYAGNLARLLELCLDSPAARNAMFLVGDFHCEVKDLVQRLAALLGSRARLWPLSQGWHRRLAGVPLLGASLQALCSPLLVDSSRVRAALHWAPPTDLDAALSRTVDWYLQEKGRAP